MKLRKKCRVHKLNEKQIQKSRTRSWRLYLRLISGKWKNCVTSDEAMFYMGGSYGRRRVCYVRENETDRQKLKLNSLSGIRLHQGLWFGQELVFTARRP
jgi:hypothetical protein